MLERQSGSGLLRNDKIICYTDTNFACKDGLPNVMFCPVKHFQQNDDTVNVIVN